MFFSIKSFLSVKKLEVDKILKAFWLFLLAISAFVLIFLSGEEVSWGQRLFNISTPEALSEINQQDETTVHNISFVFRYVYDAYLLMGIYGITSWIIFYLPISFRKIRLREYLLPVLSRWYLVPYFVVIIGYVVWRYSVNDNSFDTWEEAAELFPAIAIFLIFLRGYFHLKNYKK